MKNRKSEYDLCPDCQRPKMKHSKYCRRCSYLHRSEWKPRSDSTTHLRICPDCGGPKQVKATRCRDCKDKMGVEAYPRHATFKPGNDYGRLVNYDLLTDAWLYWFCGFFMGEGSASIRQAKHKDSSGITYTAGLNLTARYDDLAVLQDIQQKLGGSLSYNKPKKGNPEIRWNTTRFDNVKAICELLIKYNVGVAKKVQDVQIVLDYCNWRLTQPHHKPDWAAAEVFYRRCKSVKVFKEPE